MAGTIITDKIQTENAFLTLNVGQTLVATINSSGILNSSGGIMISANGAVSNTAITGLVTAAQIATVANTQITGNITSSQITSNPTFYGNVSVTGVIGVGAATPSTSGSGITFPATQSASSDANTLDDYEEGTWTGTLTSTTPPTTPPTETGTYTKIGRQVTLTINFNNVNTTGGSGTMRITGIPFSAANNPVYVGSVQLWGMSFNSYVTIYSNSGGLYFESMTPSSAWTDLAITAGTTKYVQCSVTYFTT